MPRVCVSSRLLGTAQHRAVLDDDVPSWTDRVPDGAWFLDGNLKGGVTRCLDTLLRLGNVGIGLLPPAEHVRQAQQLSGSLPADVPWQLLMPRAQHRRFVDRIVGDAMAALPQLPTRYYETAWEAGSRVLASLVPCAVDRETWSGLVGSGVGNVPATTSFEPGPDGLARPVVYDRFKTLTGRLVVGSGPQILTLKREHRRMLRSVHGARGAIFALDFAALEARIMLYEHGRRCEDADLYGMIGRELGYERRLVKGAVISEMYGSSKQALGEQLGISGSELSTFVSRIASYLGTSELLQRIKSQYLRDGFLLGRYGRPMTVDDPRDHVLVAYYGQSTGVDVSMLGFSRVLDRLRDVAPGVRPVFVLHDAMLLDVHEDDLRAVRSIDQVRVPGYVQRFKLKLEQIS